MLPVEAVALGIMPEETGPELPVVVVAAGLGKHRMLAGQESQVLQDKDMTEVVAAPLIMVMVAAGLVKSVKLILPKVVRGVLDYQHTRTCS
jgi:hypothetical protein